MIEQGKFTLIAGPCVIESAEHCHFLADQIQAQVGEFIFKASFDKANRSSIHSYRGPGMKEGLAILASIRARGIPVLTDLHEAWQAEEVAASVDVLQIPAFLCRQTDLLVAAGRTGKCVNVKKGQFVSPADMRNVVDKVRSTGNHNIVLTERGSSFGYNNLVVDMRGLQVMSELGVPVVFDATHSVQTPGGQGDKSGGNPEFIPTLARAATAAGVSGIFIETHENPAKAMSDGANALPLSQLGPLWQRLRKIHAALND
jgi:2-dehydro-3-deoxyphosphooctonate aldolase (KDO 8-P synthase)